MQVSANGLRGLPPAVFRKKASYFIRDLISFKFEFLFFCRKRYKEERKRRHRKWPLPSPSSTRFSALPRDEDDQILPLARLLRNITTIAIMLSILLGYLFHNRNNAFRRNGRRIFLIMGGTLSIIFVVIIGTLLIVYAFDFVKFALAIVLCYAVLMKILVRVIFD